MKNKKWFTLIETLLWILIASSIIIIGFEALNSITIWKVKLIESTDIEKETFKFSQKFFETVKKGWTLDYEEYFNRMVVNSWATTLYSSWHFARSTDFWNSWTVFWDFYYCRSANWTKMWTWCLEAQFNTSGQDQSGQKQRYWQYALQFIDYNSNYDNDLWDEDWDWNIKWDDDDEVLWVGPELFKTWSWSHELYLISADHKTRTIFRWTVRNDPNRPSSANCDFSNPKNPTWSGCLGTVEYLQLIWKDWWLNHQKSWTWYNDWVIDTWIISKDFVELVDWNSNEIVASWSLDKYYLSLFPNTINVKSFEVKAYPNADIEQSWQVTWIDVSPYIRIKMTLTPSWKTKKKIKWKVPEFNISTTINLNKIYSW